MKEDFVSIASIFKILYRFKFLITLILIVFIVLGYLYTKKQTKIYSSSASVIINFRAKSSVKGIDDSSSYVSFTEYEAFYKTEYERLRSIQLAKEVIKNYNLEKHPYFSYIQDKSLLPNKLISMLNIEPLSNTNKVLIRVEGIEPQFVADLANYYADSYIEYNLNRKTSHLKKSIEWLEERVKEANKTVINAEKNLFLFKKDNLVISTITDDKSNTLVERLKNLEQEYTSTRIKRIRSQKEYELLQKQKSLDSYFIPEKINLREELLVKRNNIEKLREIYKEESPKIISTKKQIKNIENQIKIIENAYREKIKNQYLLIKRKENELLNLKNKIFKDALKVEKNELIYKKNKRTSETETTIYKMLLSELKTNNLKLLLQSNNVEILDYARKATFAIKPKLKLNLVIFFFLGALFSLFIIVLIILFDNTIKTREQIEEEYGFTFLGYLPEIKIKEGDFTYKELYSVNNPHSSFAENCRSIATNIELMNENKKNKIFLVTSPGPSEGKTTIASNLAITLSEQGIKTIVIDTDLRKPRLHKVFNAKNNIGVTSFVSMEEKLENVVKNSEFENLDFISCGPIPPNALAIIKHNRFNILIEKLKNIYDVIIFDTPPTSVVSDALTISREIDGVVIVASYNKTYKLDLKESKRKFEDINSNIIGVIMNRADKTKVSYYRNYKYKKYYYYGKD